MFDQTFVNTHAEARRPWTVAASLGLQVSLLAAALIVPLFHIESIHALTTAPVFMRLEQPHPAVKPVEPVRTTITTRIRPVWNPLAAPTRVPTRILMTTDAPDLAFPATVATSGIGSVIGSGPVGMEAIRPPAPSVVKPAPLPAAPVRISAGAQAAKLIFGPKPVYPALARTARVQGTVKIQAVISRDGTIQNLQVISGPPLLVEAAITAVRQWRYRPTLLNSEPVEVATDIDVNFTLN